MNSEHLFSVALGLHEPWQVEGIEFKAAETGADLHLSICFSNGSRFMDDHEQACPVHDTVERTWQHLSFFQHVCFLHCQVPRIKTPDGRVETVLAIQQHLASKDVAPEQITDISMDMSPAFMAGAKKAFPSAKITFDRFHVVKLLNEAMDTVRKQERKDHDNLKGQKYTFLKNLDNLSIKRKTELVDLMDAYPILGEAYRLKALFNDLWTLPDLTRAEVFFVSWAKEVERSGIQAFMQFAKMVKGHWTGIARFIESRITNGLLEGISHKLQLAKRRARGYRNIQNFINMAYFLCGKLQLSFPRYGAR